MRRGISPIVALIIIVAAAAVLTIAVSMWFTSAAGRFVKHEDKLSIEFVYSDWNPELHTWIVVLHVKNIGTVPTLIDEVLINGKPVEIYKTFNTSSIGYVRGAYIYYKASWLETIEDTTNITRCTPFIETKNGVIGFNCKKLHIYTYVFNTSKGIYMDIGRMITLVILIPGPEAVEKPEFKPGDEIYITIHTIRGGRYTEKVVLV